MKAEFLRVLGGRHEHELITVIGGIALFLTVVMVLVLGIGGLWVMTRKGTKLPKERS